VCIASFHSCVCVAALAGRIAPGQELRGAAQPEFGRHPPAPAPAPAAQCHAVLGHVPQLHVWLQPGGQAVCLRLRLFHGGLQNQVCPVREAIHELPLLGPPGRGPAPGGVRGVMRLELFHTGRQLIVEIYTSLTRVMSLCFSQEVVSSFVTPLRNR